MIAIPRPDHIPSNLDCTACGHAARLHGGEGCIATRCDCCLPREQMPRLTAPFGEITSQKIDGFDRV
jgi:hypothetical protein